MRTFAMAAIGVLATAVALNPVASLAAGSAYEGTWKVKDSSGKPFEITLAGDSTARADRGEGMSGTWKEDGASAVITWNTGWTTKIMKDGDRFKKVAYKKGQSMDSAPANKSEAEKLEQR